MQETIKKKQPFTTVSLQFATSQRATALQLGLSHTIAASAGIALYFWMDQLGVQQPYPLLSALIIACLAGLLCTFNLQYSLYLLELTLARLAHDQLTDGIHIQFTRRWPLGSLFARLQETTVRVQQYVTSELLTSELRAKSLQQAGEAAAQTERNRIARELHDSIKQQIFSISISAAAARAHWQGANGGDADAYEAVEDIQRSAKEAQIEMQALLQQLRPAPLENTSLVEALRVQAQALGFRTGAQVNVEIEAMPAAEQFLPGTPETIFRLVQEAFANIAKHARASTVWLSLQRVEHTLHIEIRDDGLGFELTQVPKGMGLHNLHERAQELHGQTTITSQPGQGTRIVISLPLLEALSNPAEEARREYLLTRAIEFSRQGYQFGESAALLGLALIILATIFNIHWLVIVLGVLGALYGYARGIYYRIQVALVAGPDSKIALDLKRLEYRAYLNFSRLVGVALWYVFYHLNLLSLAAGWWELAGLLAGLTAAIQLVRRRHYLNMERYYAQLSAQELHWELERRLQSLTRSQTIWFIVIAMGLLTSHTLLFSLTVPLTPARGTAYGVAIFLLLMGFGLFTERSQIQRWRQIPTNRT